MNFQSSKQKHLQPYLNWMYLQLSSRPADFQDSAGEWICTSLAEECADEFNLYDEEYNISEEIFDLAVDTIYTFEKENQ